jgi:hypothetical protein
MFLIVSIHTINGIQIGGVPEELDEQIYVVLMNV